MNIDCIRDKLNFKKGEMVHVCFYGSRNQIDEFNGVVISLYPYIFTIKDINSNNRVKSFTYVDILTKNLLITAINR